MSDERLAEGRVNPVCLELRDVEVGGSKKAKYLEGRAVPYNVDANLGFFRERVLPGAFKKSIREAANGLPLLLFHESRQLDSHIGKVESWREADDGLHGVWRLIDTDSAQRAAQMVRDGVLGYMSIGFLPIKQVNEWDDEENLTVVLHEARLLEVSLVSTPAYAQATTTKVRMAHAGLHPEIVGRETAGWREYLSKITA